MHFDTSFTGRIFQVTEALSFDDAVSNQILALGRLFSSLGLDNTIISKWHDVRHEQSRRPIEELTPTEKDVVIYHFCGFAAHTPLVVRSQYCTRILLYHNITPHEFFAETSPQYDFCKLGRKQLIEHLSAFHYFWADSQFNLQELIELGAPRDRCDVIPIIVPVPAPRTIRDFAADSKIWLFVGRIAPNKCQIKLLNLFAAVRQERPELATELHLIGGYDENDVYYLQLKKRLDDLELADVVKIHGKISDARRDDFFERAGIYVSLSEHEGFGVPLIEASLHGVPVLALGTSAVSETLGFGAGVAPDSLALKQRLVRMLTQREFCEDLLRKQRINAMRFAPEAVAACLRSALQKVLPAPRQFRRVSVVICTYNRCSFLERVLDYLGYQSCGLFEVIVVDGPSTDGTKELLAARADPIKVAHNPERNLSKSRNLGIELSDGDIVAFIDDDALPFDNWIENILRAYNERPLTTAGLGGPAYYAGTFWFQAEDNGVNSRAEAKVNIASDQIGRNGWWRYNTGTNATFSASVLRDASGFDEQFDYYLDESEVCLRLQQRGLLIGYSDRIVVRHEFAQSHNRLGRLNYNWYTISKNTAYFICAYSGLTGDELEDYIRLRMATERIAPLDQALAAGELKSEEYNRHVEAIWSGVERGIADAKDFPRRRVLKLPPGRFMPYGISGAFTSFEAGRRRLHVVIVSKEFPPFAPGGGIGTLYYYLASELLLMGHQISVIVPGENEHVFKQGNISVHFTPLREIAMSGAEPGFVRNISWSLCALTKVAEIHACTPIDVVDSALWDSEALSLVLLPPHQRPPVVVRLVTPYAIAARINEWSPPVHTAALFVGAERALIQCADAVVPISESIASSIESTYDVRRTIRWHKIPCGIAYWPTFDVNQGYSDIPQLEGIPRSVLESSRLVLFVGRLERRKGIDLVLQASKQFLRTDPTARLIIAGRDVEGWEPRLSSIVPDELRSRIYMLGEVSDATRDKLLALAYCLLFPSRYESFGLVPLEAFVHGVPVVASDSGAIPEVIEDGISGLLFPEGDVSAFAGAISKLLADAELRASLSAGALQRVRVLSSRRSAIRSYALYDSLLTARAISSTAAG
jgi:glycosyltransferase involved in cell wall biosynthesis